jgi:hypothetical protein
MSNEKRGFQGGIRVKPNAEGVAKEGDINVDGSSKIKAFLDSAEREVVTADQVQTLSNKVIDGTSSGSNTVTIDASSAVYDPAGNTQISGTDMQAALDSADIAIQTNATNLSNHIGSLTVVHAASAISSDNSTFAPLTDTEFYQADNVQGTLEEFSVVLADGEDRLEAFDSLFGVPSKDTDLGTFTGTTIPDNTDTKSALQSLETKAEANTSAITSDAQDLVDHENATSAHGTSSAVVGASDTQTLTNKTINNENNTLNGFHQSSFIITNPSGKAFADNETGGDKPVPTGDVVGTSDSQTLTNKTIQGASIQDPSRLDVKKDTFANLETYAASAADGQIVFATDTKQTFVIKDNALSEFSGGGSGAGDLNSIPLDLTAFTGDDTLRTISSNRSFNITSGTLNVNHINGFTDSLIVSGISSKFLDKDLELVMSFRSSSTPDSISVVANGNTFALTNDSSVTYSGNKWDTQLPDMPSEELVFDIGQLGSESTTIQLAYTDQASTHYTNAYQGVHLGDNENIQNEAYYDSYSSSYYNRTFVASASGYTIVRDNGITEIPDDVNASPNSFFLDRVYFSAIGATSAVRVDEVNGRGFFAQGQVIAASNNPNVALGSFTTYGNSASLNGAVVDMFAHDGEMLACAGSLYYSTDTSISSGLGLQINSSILGPKFVTRDPISGLWYVCNNAGEVYELDSVFDTSPTLLDTFTSVEGLSAYNGRIWVAHDSGVDVIGYGSIVSGSFTDVKFDVRSNIVYATTAGNLYGCAYSANSMELLRAVGQFSGSMKLSCYGARNSSQGTLTASQSDKVYIVEQNADGFMVIHGSPTSQIADMSIRIKEQPTQVVFKQVANYDGLGGVTGTQTITQSNFAVREINSQDLTSSDMRLDTNRIYLKKGKYRVDISAQQYDGNGYLNVLHIGIGSGSTRLTSSVGHVSGTPIVGWHHGSLILDVTAAESYFEIEHYASSAEPRPTVTGYVPTTGSAYTTPIMEVKVTKL